MLFYKTQYINGNYLVTCTNYGKTKKYTVLRLGEDFNPNFPDSIDLKITNKCSHNCPFCHESSNSKGKSFNLENTKNILSDLPQGVEIAIGGGNIFDCFTDFKKLLCFLVSKGYYTRATINILDLFDKNKQNLIVSELFGNKISDKLLGALGISITNFNQIELFNEEYKEVYFDFSTYNTDLVFHIILGIFPIEDLQKLLDFCSTYRFGILILGFKKFGRGINMDVSTKIDHWKKEIKNIIYKIRRAESSYTLTVGFDNLAIEQLDLPKFFTQSEWNTFYQGNDFSHTMYVDAVEEEFAPTSRSPKEDRVSWKDNTLCEYFKKNHVKWN